MHITPVNMPNGDKRYLAQQTIKNKKGEKTFFVSVTGRTHFEAIKNALEAITRPA